MTKKELLKAIDEADIKDDEVIVCGDLNGGWDNIERIDRLEVGNTPVIVFGGGSPFSDGG